VSAHQYHRRRGKGGWLRLRGSDIVLDQTRGFRDECICMETRCEGCTQMQLIHEEGVLIVRGFVMQRNVIYRNLRAEYTSHMVDWTKLQRYVNCRALASPRCLQRDKDDVLVHYQWKRESQPRYGCE
jgi:hypothetical protein